MPQWRAEFTSEELSGLHALCFRYAPQPSDWWGRLNSYSLGWVCSRSEGELIGFANLAWDGGQHAFLLDVLVHPSHQRSGLGSSIVSEAVERARRSGCAWLHVDFEPHLQAFYQHCGFTTTHAGLIDLT